MCYAGGERQFLPRHVTLRSRTSNCAEVVSLSIELVFQLRCIRPLSTIVLKLVVLRLLSWVSSCDMYFLVIK